VLAAATLQILTAVLIISSLFLILQCVTAGVGRPMITTKAISVMALLNVILNLILIPPYRIAGAAMATLISQFVGLLILLYLTGKFVKFTVPVSSIFKTIAAGLLTLLFIVGLKSLVVLDPWWLRAIVVAVPSLLLYVGIILVTRAFNRDDLELLGSTMPVPKKLIEAAKRLTK
jgi:Na+-driven multidrug efflux pump